MGSSVQKDCRRAIADPILRRNNTTFPLLLQRVKGWLTTPDQAVLERHGLQMRSDYWTFSVVPDTRTHHLGVIPNGEGND